jgi:hypothetical protein
VAFALTYTLSLWILHFVHFDNLGHFVSVCCQAETRVNEAERTVQLLQKEVDKLEGMQSVPVISLINRKLTDIEKRLAELYDYKETHKILYYAEMKSS